MSNQKTFCTFQVVSVVLSVLLCSCTGVTPVSLTATANAPIVLENKGRVCLYVLSPTKLRLEISTDPFVCFSSTCTQQFESTGNVQVDANNHVIQITSRFKAAHLRNLETACTADCGGAGRVNLETGDLAPGTWSVRLGQDTIGQVQVPFLMSQPCFDNVPTQTPAPTVSYPPISPTPSRTPRVSPLGTPALPGGVSPVGTPPPP